MQIFFFPDSWGLQGLKILQLLNLEPTFLFMDQTAATQTSAIGADSEFFILLFGNLTIFSGRVSLDGDIGRLDDYARSA